MTPTNPESNDSRPGDNALAFGIMFLAVALLTLMLGWAEGVRHDSRILHIPETRTGVTVGLILVVIGVLFVLWSRRRRSAS